MTTTVTLTTRDVVQRGLHDAVVELDRRNMAGILAAAGLAFPEEKRRKAFECDGMFFFILASEGEILGYLELCPDFHCPEEDLYVSSLQIVPEHRAGPLLAAR